MLIISTKTHWYGFQGLLQIGFTKSGTMKSLGSQETATDSHSEWF